MSAESLQIASQGYQVTVALQGAELRSYQHTATSRELIWQADPAFWAGSAPVLFPIVGRLKNDAYEFEGRQFAMGGHGIVRKRAFKVLRHEPAELEFCFSETEETLLEYPFRFELHVTFRLQGARLLIDYCVKNNDDRPMPFSIGSHPAFALRKDSNFSEYSIEFSEPETLDLYRLDGTLISQSVQSRYLNNARFLVLQDDMFETDALIFKHIRSDAITLVDNKTNQPVITVDTGGAPHLGIWSKPNADFLCIEPWHGYSDSVNASGRLQDKLAMKWLDPGYSFDAGYGISVKG
jgi:galactose mutarotase-like enzyme